MRNFDLVHESKYNHPYWYKRQILPPILYFPREEDTETNDMNEKGAGIPRDSALKQFVQVLIDPISTEPS